MGPIRLGLVGIGKIARDQHLPAIAADDRFVLTATASRNASVPGLPGYANLDELIAAETLDAVSFCTPPSGRYELARRAIEAGLHVMIEKPPAATLTEIEDLAVRARAAGVTLFASWHSREAAGVAPARAWLAGRRIDAVTITWKENIRQWHPGQEWILEAGGFGVFDPGINALSIASAILPETPIVEGGTLTIPEGRATPIAASLRMRSGTAPVQAEFDFLQTGPQTWDIDVETDAGTLTLAHGGATLTLPGEAAVPGQDREYPRLYAHFAELVGRAAVDVDVAPLRLIADALLVSSVKLGPAFSY